MHDFVPTRAAMKRKDAENAHVLTIFEMHKKVQSKPNVHAQKVNDRLSRDQDEESHEDMDNESETVDERRKQELDMKRYRYEVIKFGMSNAEKKEAMQAKVALAISLGAKPPKNKNINYKKLLQQKSEEKAKEEKKDKFASGISSSQWLMKNGKNNKSKVHNKKEKDGILNVYGKVTKDDNRKRKGGRVQKRKS